MPEPVQPPAPAVEETPTDMFGFPTAPAPETAPPAAEKKPDEQKPVSVEDLTKRLDDYDKKFADLHDANTKKDENIRVMRDLIKEFRKSGGKPAPQDQSEQKPAAIFETVKTSKDLTQAERDDMTETEIRQMDEIAALKNGMNQLFKAISDGKSTETKPDANEDDDDEGAGGGDKDEAVKSARTIALELAGNDETVANEIIEQVNKFNIVGLKPEDLRKRVEDANKLRPTYTPPKEPVKKPGAPVKGGGSANDPFGVDQIINDVQKSRTSGNVYKL